MKTSNIIIISTLFVLVIGFAINATGIKRIYDHTNWNDPYRNFTKHQLAKEIDRVYIFAPDSVDIWTGDTLFSVIQGKDNMSQSFFDKKMSVNLSVSDPFKKSLVYTTNSNDPYFTQHSETIYPSRSLRCSVTYNFGKSGMDVKKARRGIQNDDVKSGGSSNGSSSGSGGD